MVPSFLGHRDDPRAPEGRPNGRPNDLLKGRPNGRLNGRQSGQGAVATIARRSATAPASTESWTESVTGKRKRGRARIRIRIRIGTERDGGPAAETGTKNDENAEEVAAAVGTEEANAKTKKEMVEKTGSRGRKGTTIKIEALRVRSPGIRRAGERLMTGGTKRTGRDTEKKGKPKGWVGVEAGKGSTKVARRKIGNESAATAKRKTGTETGNSAPTNVVVAKRRVIISESPIMTIVNIVSRRSQSTE